MGIINALVSADRLIGARSVSYGGVDDAAASEAIARVWSLAATPRIGLLLA